MGWWLCWTLRVPVIVLLDAFPIFIGESALAGVFPQCGVHLIGMGTHEDGEAKISD